MEAIPIYSGRLIGIDTDQMIEVDRLMIEVYGIELLQMMENAGRCLSIVAVNRFLQPDTSTKKVAVLAGTGGNGGGAMVSARRLSNWGVNVSCFIIESSKTKPDSAPAIQKSILEKAGVTVHGVEDLDDLQEIDLIIDGLIGYSLDGPPTGESRLMIEWANSHEAPVLSLDTPSGLDLTTGEVSSPCIFAEATVTLALPKKGLFTHEAKKVRGELFLADISVPPRLYQEPSLNLQVPNFFEGADIIRID
ncbi:MAG: NAD(P)H-hydrate epimerase [Bacteroidota bacterium]